MNKNLSALLSLFILLTFSSFAQTTQWANTIKSEGFDEGYDLTTDSQGNTYVAGMMEYTTDFGNGVLLSSAGVHDIYLAKYSPTGRLVWARRAGGKGGDKIQSIVLDGQGHIYVAGEFEDTCYWENIMLATPLIEVNNMFIAKYDTSGSVMWVRNLGTTGVIHTRGYGVTCDAQGNVYACGGTKGDTYFNGTYLFTSAGDYDGTVVKFDPNGNFRWARRMGGADSDKAYGIASDNNGSIYVTGYFVGNADFSPTVTLHGTGHTDIFLAKYDTSGTLQWAKMAGDTGFDRGWDVTVNVNGEILITGECQTGYFGTHMIHTRGNEDMFLASYDNNGNNLWVLEGGGAEDDIGRGISHDVSGNIYVIGDYASTGIFTPDTIHSNGYADVFVACYSSDGTTLKWIRSMGGLDSDRGRGVASDLAGNINICGEYIDSIHFDSTNLIGDSLLDIFVGRIVLCNSLVAQISLIDQNACNGQCNGSATVSASGQAPFTYEWSTSPSQFTATATSLCQGQYTVTTTDNVDCTETTTATLTDPDAIQETTSITDATCIGCSNASIDASITGGTTAYTFLWSNGAITEDLQNITAGTYQLCVTDANSCSLCSSYTVLEPSTGVSALNSTNGVSIYPNPFSDFTTLHFTHSPQEVIELTVFSAAARRSGPRAGRRR